MTTFEQYVRDVSCDSLVNGIAQLYVDISTGKLPLSSVDDSIGDGPREMVQIFRERYPDVEIPNNSVLGEWIDNRINELYLFELFGMSDPNQ